MVSASTGVMGSLLSKLSMLLRNQYKQLKRIRMDIEFLSRELTDMNAALEMLADTEKLDIQTKIANRIRMLRGHYQIAKKIQELRARVVEQSESRDRYKIVEGAATSTQVPLDPRVQVLFEDAKRLVGIDGPRDKIIRWLMQEDDSHSRPLKVISIVGFGGLGKTTLANQVYNKIKIEFECTTFITYCPELDMVVDDIQKLISIIRSQITNKRYLIIVDDIWSINAWEIIKCIFVENNNGSRVITTTKCKGVPLTITSIASLLANKSMHVETWERIHNSLGSELDTNPTLEWMRHVELLRKWIAEGFIREKHSLGLEEVAENLFNELINRSMIQPSLNDSGGVWSCRVHDLMLDLIITKCTEQNFITLIDRKFDMNGTFQVRRISHQFNNRDMALAVKTMSLSQVRSYKSFPMANCMPSIFKFEVRGFRLKLPKKFGELKHLLTVDVSFVWLYPSNQSSDFTSLSALRHLILPSTQESLVRRNGISRLCNLRTLFHFDIRTNSLECIRDLCELANLRELFLD
uniref:NB-ARC domain-containing protein n=1 Tax=Setaria italica TaxID=4555 RepID=K3ZEJ4_SETIT